jgi:hypothetical protein
VRGSGVLRPFRFRFSSELFSAAHKQKQNRARDGRIDTHTAARLAVLKVKRFCFFFSSNRTHNFSECTAARPSSAHTTARATTDEQRLHTQGKDRQRQRERASGCERGQRTGTRMAVSVCLSMNGAERRAGLRADWACVSALFLDFF